MGINELKDKVLKRKKKPETEGTEEKNIDENEVEETEEEETEAEEKAETKKVKAHADVVPSLDQRKLPLDTIRYTPDPKTGLNDEQVNERNEKELTNRSNSGQSKSIGRIIYENVVTYFNVLLFALAAVLIVFGQYGQITFLFIAILNTLIGIYQEIKAKKTIDKLKLVTSSSFQVMRNGEKIVLQTEGLVLDDIYFIKIGDQIPTDSILMEGKIEVNESLLTGESLPITKNPGDKIYAGSFVVSGSATLRADLVGEYNYISGIQAKAKEVNKPKSELVRSLNAVIKVIGIIIIPLGGLTFWTQWLYYASPSLTTWEIVTKAVTAMAASMIGMIPSGMYLLTSIALAGSVLSLSKQNALVQNLYSVEMLARVNVLCLDKTGTLTDGTMRVDEILMIDNSYQMDDLVGSYLSAFSESNQTSIALSQRFPLKKEYKVVNQIPFSSARKYSAVEFHGMGTFVLGAPEYIFKGRDKTLTDYLAKKQVSGYRVVMLCHSDNSIINGEIKDKFKPVAVFALEDHIRSEAPDTIRWFVENGVAIKIISGDNPLTASEIAGKCGVPDAGKCISLEGLNETQVRDIVNEYAVFGRVSPEQKAIIVSELKTQGKTVGMTGDGVNDILAMKTSDCSVAMANGSSAARNAANLVLLDSNFASMPAAVKEGRRAINNVQRSSALYLMKTLFTIIFTIIVLITYTNNGNGIRYPFDPNNLLITEMVCIGFVSLFLSVQQNSSQIKGKFLTNTFIRAVPAALCLVAAIGLNYIFRYTGNFLDFTSTSGVLTEADELGFKTLNSLSMTFVAIGVAYNCCLPVFPLSDKQCRFRFIGFCLAILIIVLMIFGLGNMPATSDKYHSLCEQLVGIDYHYLNKTMWLLLFIYLTGFSSLLSVLVRLAESTFGVGKPIFQLKKPDVEQPKIINHDMVSIEEKKAEAKKNV
jgi:cation-transporting P-type ATPase E